MRSGEKYDKSQPRAVFDTHLVDFGPSFIEGLPSGEDWEAFRGQIPNLDTLAFCDLWYQKAQEKQEIPLRKDFDVREFAKFSSHLILYKATDDDRWLTTFCGDEIVHQVGMEITGKHMDEYADAKTLKYWMRTIVEMVDGAKPFMENYVLEYAGRSHMMCHCINLPLKGERDSGVNMFICHETYSAR